MAYKGVYTHAIQNMQAALKAAFVVLKVRFSLNAALKDTQIPPQELFLFIE